MSTKLNMLEVLGMETHAITQQLNENFPPVSPTPDDSIEKIMYRSGQRSVVEWLLTRMET